ncbi:MAG: 6-pyruvoyl-tetrahydropterin synthase-related protein [Dehalococcoidia bacterium]|nr:6-pyruvoyl-tetrahydropterin synthase-related protein [Dehalococcoidia bacterium]
MNRQHSKFSALLVALSAAFSTMPLLQPYFFASSDGLFHLYRLMEYDLLLKGGIWYPRWAPDFFFGAGMPLFNYYAPLTYYLAEFFHLMGAGYIDSLRLLVFASMVLSGLGALLYARTFFSPLASLLVAIVYMYAPYHIVNLYYRGDIAEYLAYTWFPFILWALIRLVQRKSYAYLFAGSVFYAALILTHNLSALIFSGFLIIYSLSALVGEHRTGLFVWRELLADTLRVLTMATAALALSTFFWLPAMAERSLISLDRLLAAINFHEYFPTVEELFSTDLIHRYGIVFRDADVFGFRLGAFQTVFLFIGLALLVWQRRRLKPGAKLEGFASLAITGVCLFLIFPISVWVWESLPMLSLTQFPWRFLAFIALPGAFLAGLIVQSLPERIRSLAVVAIVPAVIASSVAAMFPILTNVTESQVTSQDSIALELMTGGIGTTAADEYLPIWVKGSPRSTPLALATVLDESTTNSSGRSSAWIEVSMVERKGDSSSYRVHAARAGSFIPNLTYFPGWVAFVDGREVPITVDDPSGFIQLLVPEGDHAVSLRFQDTPVRRLSDAVSVTALVFLIGLLFWRYGRVIQTRIRALWPSNWRRQVLPDRTTGKRDRLSIRRLPRLTITRDRLAKVAIILALVPIWLLAKSNFDSVYASAGTYDFPLVANLDDEVVTVGYAFSGADGKPGTPAPVIPGSSIRFTIFWRQLGRIPKDQYKPFARLTNRFAQTWAYAGTSIDQSETGPGGGNVVSSTFNMAVPEGTPPGTYEIEVSFDNTATKKILEVRRVWVVPVLPSKGVRIGPLVVGRGPSSNGKGIPPLGSPDRPSVGMPVSFDETLRLLDLAVTDGEARKSGKPGLPLPRGPASGPPQIRAGEVLHFDLLFQALRKISDDYTITARLMGPDRDLWAIRDSLPADGTYPTSFWARGEVVRDQLDIAIPPETPPGQYELQLEVVSAKGPLSIIGGNGAPVGPTLRIGEVSILTAASPARPGDVKISQHKVMPVLANLDIVGFELSRRELRPGEQLNIDLVWRAATDIIRDMVARITIVTPSGDTLVTTTRRPVGNAYPTTSWRQGEVLRGKYSLQLPAKGSEGEAKVIAILLDAKSGDALGQVDLGNVHILPRTHIFSASPGRPLTADFEDKARLLGFDLAIGALIPAGQAPKVAPSDTFNVTLYWQALREMETSYIVFIQILNGAGKLVAQNDSPPQAGEAPTTAWIAGEVVTDGHRISIPTDLPDGDYTVIAGVYDATTGIRLAVKGDNYIALTRLLVSSKG